jgi:hypothetical protein
MKHEIMRVAICLVGFLRTFEHDFMKENFISFVSNVTTFEDVFAVVSRGMRDSTKGQKVSNGAPLHLRKNIPNWFEMDDLITSLLNKKKSFKRNIMIGL